MSGVQIVITQAGLEKLVDAQNADTDPIVVTEVGLTAATFVHAPTLTALPGEIKRLDAFAGQSVSESVIHMTAMDPSADIYDMRGFGLYLSDGTLFGVYGQADPIFRKVSIATFLLAFDIAFESDVSTAVEFGDATFLYPPASETVKGVAEIATQVEVSTGTDDLRIVTPLKLKTRLDALVVAIDAAWAAAVAVVQASLTALLARTITGGGLVTGGGDLTASRTLTVTAASGADVAAGSAADKAVTPAAIAAVPQTFGANASILGLGGAITKMGSVSVTWPGTTSVTFPVAFPTACDRVLIVPEGDPTGSDESDEPWWVPPGSLSDAGFQITAGGDGFGISFGWVAYGH